MAPKTINRRVSSVSSFYKYLQGAASELRLPITVPNPAHAQFIARDMFEQVNLPGGQPMKIPGIVPKLSDTPGSTEWLGPKLGEHTDEILASLGYAPQEIAALREKGAV